MGCPAWSPQGQAAIPHQAKVILLRCGSCGALHHLFAVGFFYPNWSFALTVQSSNAIAGEPVLTGNNQVSQCCPNTVRDGAGGGGVMLCLGGTSPTAAACLCLLPYAPGGELGHEEGLTCKTGLELMCRVLH